ncbi:MAG: hypothetical protein ACXWF8_18980 [Methylobacter sp.]
MHLVKNHKDGLTLLASIGSTALFIGLFGIAVAVPAWKILSPVLRIPLQARTLAAKLVNDGFFPLWRHASL